jgi:hypothetical protein
MNFPVGTPIFRPLYRTKNPLKTIELFFFDALDKEWVGKNAQ